MEFLKKHKKIWLIFLTGLFVRLLVIPWSMHADLLSMSWRAHLMAVHGSWSIPTNQFLGHFIYALDLWILKLFGFPLTEIYSLEFGLQEGSFTASVGDWLRFNESNQINALLFYLKIPHLIADTLIFYLLYRTFKVNKHTLLVLTSWWFNPVNLYAFYIFARHDAITALALLLTILFTARNKVWPALISLFAAIQIRLQPLIYTPVFLAALWKQQESLQKLVRQAAIAVGIVVIYLLGVQLLPANEQLLTSLSKATAAPTAVGIPQKHSQQILSTFLSAYAILGFTYFFFVRVPKETRRRLQQLSAVLVVLMSLYFALNDFYPHYFVWLSLFVSLVVAWQPKVIWPYAGAVIGFLGMGVTATNNFSINQNLFMPISTTIFRTPQITTMLLARGIDPQLLFSGFKIFLSFNLLVLAVMVFKKQLLPDLHCNKQQVLKLLPIVAFLTIISVPKPTQALTAPVLQTQSATNQVSFSSENTIISQTFTVPTDTFGSIEVRLNTYGIPDSEPVIFRIKAVDSEEWLYEAEYNRADFYSGYYYPFGFPTITNAKDKKYSFELEYSEEAKAPLSVYANDSGELDFNVLSNDTAAFITILQNDITEKLVSQQLFFSGYGLLLLGTLASIGYVLFTKEG